MKFVIIYDASKIISVLPFNEGDIIAATGYTLIDTYENLLTVLTALNIDAQPLHTAKDDYERYLHEQN